MVWALLSPVGVMARDMTMASELLVEAMGREQAQLDEKLYLEVFQVPAPAGQAKDKRRAARQAVEAR